MKCLLVFAALLAAAVGGAWATGNAPDPALWSAGLPAGGAAEDPFEGIVGLALGAEEAAALEGGDVYMSLNEERTRLRVDVYSNERDAGMRSRPQESYEVDAHNRIVERRGAAPFMPAPGASRAGDPAGMTSTPVRFPEGVWQVGQVAARADSYGPNMIKTNAVGSVEVFDARGNPMGRRADIGYAIHSNAADFGTSRSYGCIVVRREDNARIARSIELDRADSPRSRQSISAGRGR